MASHKRNVIAKIGTMPGEPVIIIRPWPLTEKHINVQRIFWKRPGRNQRIEMSIFRGWCAGGEAIMLDLWY